ncbi:Ferredoxin [Clostridiaceae bacterium JG1575]|nr:Ferredoxin [Clostridiaceae bacterium JG1575]
MKPVVDKELCVGCGLCASMAPDVFIMEDDGKAGVVVEATEDAATQEAADSCPVAAITIA